MNPIIHNIPIFMFSIAGLLSSLCAQSDLPPTLGVTESRPSSGQFVELEDRRFMIPYTTKLPGTKVEFSMMPVPGGIFVDRFKDSEKRDREVRIKIEPFWMAKYEVSWAEFQRYMAMEGFFKKFHKQGTRLITEKTAIDAVTAPSALYDPSYTYCFGDLPNQPAVSMTQYSAKQFTKWLSLSTGEFYRLPYDSEWEYACRAGSTTKYYFGDDAKELVQYAWFDDNSDEYSMSVVGKLKPNAWGLHDMLGNANEWTLDQYTELQYEHLNDTDLSKPISAEVAYNKPTKLYPRVTRGGSIYSLSEECSCEFRIGSEKDWQDMDPSFPRSPWWLSSDQGNQTGFRIVRPLKTVERKSQEEFWKSGLESIEEGVKAKIDYSSRGARAAVDQKLHLDIEKLNRKTKPTKK